ncbi:MAG TPA: hypothetical protein VJB70_02315 [Candidatus Paceibacterota bacterium]
MFLCDKESDPLPTSWDAERIYGENPFALFWEKEHLLRQMTPGQAERVAESDVFLPDFSKRKFYSNT